MKFSKAEWITLLVFMGVFTLLDFYLLNSLLDPYDHKLAGLDSRLGGLEAQGLDSRLEGLEAQQNSAGKTEKQEVKSDT